VDRVTPGRRRRSVAAVDSGPDETGVGPVGAVGAVLLLGGAAVIIAGLTTLLPAWAIVVGIVVFALGGAAPLWSFWRRRVDARHADDAPGPEVRR
jgi:membrane protein implicated in regulation of membrane protease activity